MRMNWEESGRKGEKERKIKKKEERSWARLIRHLYFKFESVDGIVCANRWIKGRDLQKVFEVCIQDIDIFVEYLWKILKILILKIKVNRKVDIWWKLICFNLAKHIRQDDSMFIDQNKWFA